MPGSTNLTTTPYDVFVNRRGVCQDFANLFICMARLLGIPARYVRGYLYTGNVGASRAGSDATHAWVQLYIPNIGWKGFDPTNGVLASLDHVRVGYGRNYMDATPTAGTLYTAAAETMNVDVTVSEVDSGLSAGSPAHRQAPVAPSTQRQRRARDRGRGRGRLPPSLRPQREAPKVARTDPRDLGASRSLAVLETGGPLLDARALSGGGRLGTARVCTPRPPPRPLCTRHSRGRRPPRHMLRKYTP